MASIDLKWNTIRRFQQAFEQGDLPAMDQLLSRNFRERIDDLPEVCRFQYLDTLSVVFDATKFRNIEIKDLTNAGDDFLASATIRYVSESMDWAIECTVQIAFEDDELIERLCVSDQSIRYFDPWQAQQLSNAGLVPGDIGFRVEYDRPSTHCGHSHGD